MLISLTIVQIAPEFNFYRKNQVSQEGGIEQHDCFDYDTRDKHDRTYQIISYCLPVRLTDTNVGYYVHNFIIVELRQQNLSSQQLYEWGASLDDIEIYQIELQQTNSSVDSHNIFF